MPTAIVARDRDDRAVAVAETIGTTTIATRRAGIVATGTATTTSATATDDRADRRDESSGDDDHDESSGERQRRSSGDDSRGRRAARIVRWRLERRRRPAASRAARIVALGDGTSGATSRRVVGDGSSDDSVRRRRAACNRGPAATTTRRPTTSGSRPVDRHAPAIPCHSSSPRSRAIRRCCARNGRSRRPWPCASPPRSCWPAAIVAGGGDRNQDRILAAAVDRGHALGAEAHVRRADGVEPEHEAVLTGRGRRPRRSCRRAGWRPHATRRPALGDQWSMRATPSTPKPRSGEPSRLSARDRGVGLRPTWTCSRRGALAVGLGHGHRVDVVASPPKSTIARPPRAEAAVEVGGRAERRAGGQPRGCTAIRNGEESRHPAIRARQPALRATRDFSRPTRGISRSRPCARSAAARARRSPPAPSRPAPSRAARHAAWAA